MVTVSESPNAVGVYLHWNGGPESVLGMLAACRELGFRDPTADDTYGMGYFQAAAALFFGDGLSTGMGPMSGLDTDNGDNGVWIICRGWNIRKPGDAHPVVMTPEQIEKAGKVRAKIVARWKAAMSV